jgi:hypothetical protein
VEPDYIKSSTSKQKHWEKHISCWKKSGLTQRQYCFSQGIAISTFSYWKGKLGKVSESPKPARFFALTVKDADTLLNKQDSPTGIRLFVCNDKFKIDLDKEFSESTLKKLITTLETF